MIKSINIAGMDKDLGEQTLSGTLSGCVSLSRPTSLREWKLLILYDFETYQFANLDIQTLTLFSITVF